MCSSKSLFVIWSVCCVVLCCVVLCCVVLCCCVTGAWCVATFLALVNDANMMMTTISIRTYRCESDVMIERQW